MKLKKIAAMLTVAGLAAPAFATNGMNMEGYGPIATGMGGASMAFDNGTAAMINNAATLGLMKSGTSRLDLAIGGLHPDVTAKDTGAFGTGRSATSGGDAYYMPAIGYARKDGNLTWGIGMMSQGGMGTEWGTGSWVTNPTTINMMLVPPGTAPTPAAFTPSVTNRTARTELGVGRIMFPLAYDVAPNFRLGGSLDYVWAGLDAKMVFDMPTFGAMGGNINNANKNLVGYATGATFTPGSGFGINMMGWAYAGAGINAVNYYVDMDRGTDKFSQQLTGNAVMANIGFQWAATKELSIGATYRPEVDFGDLTGSATITGLTATGAVAAGGTAVAKGNMRIVGFKWPETIGVGVAFQATPALLLAADYKNIGWKSVMQQFHMKFTSGGQVAEFGLNQNWKDQNVFALGLAYKMTDAVTLRAGANLSDNPIPEANMTPYFPATVENAYTLGLGWAVSKEGSLDFSASFIPDVSVTNAGCANPGGQQGYPGCFGNTAVSHSQTNWQAMYSHRF
jgi:long-chain fatty acid transport protein